MPNSRTVKWWCLFQSKMTITSSAGTVAFLSNVLHRGLAYFINLDGQTIRFNGVEKFFEEEKGPSTGAKTPESKSVALKMNGEFMVVTFVNGWLIVQSKTAPMGAYIGNGRNIIVVNALRNLLVKFQETRDAGQPVPQTLQGAIIALRNLLRLDEKARMAYLVERNGNQLLCELRTGRHFVQFDGAELTRFGERVNGVQLYPDNLQDDQVFDKVPCLPKGASDEKIASFELEHICDEGMVQIVYYTDGTFQRFKVKFPLYNQVFKGMPTVPTGLRHILFTALSRGELLDKVPQGLSPELREAVTAYGAQDGRPQLVRPGMEGTSVPDPSWRHLRTTHHRPGYGSCLWKQRLVRRRLP